MKKLSTVELKRDHLDQFKCRTKLPVTLVLDSVRSMNNVGSVFRTADAFAVESVYLCGITGTPPHREIKKTALGATETVRWEYFENVSDALRKLKAESRHIIAVEQLDVSVYLDKFVPPGGPIAFVFGNELEGVSDEALSLCDSGIEIPQFGTKHSFNIAVSTGIVMWDFYSKREL